MQEIRVELTKHPKQKPAPDGPLPFGTVFTDHMFVMDYTEGKGWHDPRIVPYAPLQLDPAAIVLHYAQESFEGMKAYRTPGGTIQLFRPEKNAARFKSTHERMCMPIVPENDFVEAVKALVKTEKDWVPA
ncbi:MAG: branched chain amino acid aminotransferase, partial [Oscillospiraceae bacterium]|nr:branched chain amino acid aminotransferase [Oscillospiraceae bacterium]